MSKIIPYITEQITKLTYNKKIPSFRAGDTIRVHNIIIESDKQRIQIFEGLCIALYNKNIASSFKLKRISQNMIFEKTFLVYSPLIKHIEIIRKGRVRRSKLYFMRQLMGKAARIKERT